MRLYFVLKKIPPGEFSGFHISICFGHRRSENIKKKEPCLELIL